MSPWRPCWTPPTCEDSKPKLDHLVPSVVIVRFTSSLPKRPRDGIPLSLTTVSTIRYAAPRKDPSEELEEGGKLSFKFRGSQWSRPSRQTDHYWRHGLMPVAGGRLAGRAKMAR
jgi:hypothetical protein